jgi:hypothetical protein
MTSLTTAASVMVAVDTERSNIGAFISTTNICESSVPLTTPQSAMTNHPPPSDQTNGDVDGISSLMESMGMPLFDIAVKPSRSPLLMSSPFITKSANIVVNGINTQLMVQPFRDRTFVIITQFNKIGTLVV